MSFLKSTSKKKKEKKNGWGGGGWLGELKKGSGFRKKSFRAEFHKCSARGGRVRGVTHRARPHPAPGARPLLRAPVPCVFQRAGTKRNKRKYKCQETSYSGGEKGPGQLRGGAGHSQHPCAPGAPWGVLAQVRAGHRPARPSVPSWWEKGPRPGSGPETSAQRGSGRPSPAHWPHKRGPRIRSHGIRPAWPLRTPPEGRRPGAAEGVLKRPPPEFTPARVLQASVSLRVSPASVPTAHRAHCRPQVCCFPSCEKGKGPTASELPAALRTPLCKAQGLSVLARPCSPASAPPES